MSKVKFSALQDISSSAAEVLLAIAGKHEDVSKNDSTEMCRLWDNLNDHSAPPAVVKSMADELINLRKQNQRLLAQRIADRRRFSNPAPIELLSLVCSETKTGKELFMHDIKKICLGHGYTEQNWNKGSHDWGDLYDQGYRDAGEAFQEARRCE
ncbi:hypothetical protein PRCB_16375 [Pantoea rodasii]|uniref:Uncharacterized protein n=1 Tax=Pantoea rodasii TaxID=1076549 RepID=A0A2M9WBW9_9GAMM|nr:hypothetical protein [Pantoea rodasii]ORM64508.1 hypothetical protein HA45_09045 [Pantoea rodasii]PJZ04978.1 hypothetical protein PRCB_16375 [Pantoea rodasii]